MSFIYFEEIPRQLNEKRLTRRWLIKTAQDNSVGEIRWYAPWRRYVFYPRAACLFDQSCLDDISAFLEIRMEQRLHERAVE